ncbi:dna-binding hexbp [Pyrenophora seminiperda CCB06]|uniref:Dna-binding hexbp n=1 Tax=Pyrenophora seminiperda CCB06 TaxID=1302712 RepID=A0A3M7M5E0_9PLEO|nr:dna-binding hexbp [Pyrenophora seminiperda CCB06]
MAATLDTRRMRSSTKGALRDYYKQLLSDASAEIITAQLLEAVERGSIPPSVFAPWLDVSQSPTAIREALIQNKSVQIRSLGVAQLRKALSSLQWQENWDGVGGVAGLLDIFADLSVLEIKEVCKAIGSCGRGDDLDEKRRHFTELFKALHPDHFPDALHKSHDRRLLDKHYRHLMPACSDELIEHVIVGGSQGVWREAYGKGKYLLKYHPRTLQRVFLRSLYSEKPPSIDKKLLVGLLHHYPMTKTDVYGFSESMMFSLEFLKTLIESGCDGVEDEFFTKQLVGPLLGRAIKKHAEWGKIKEIVDLTVFYLNSHPSAGRRITTAEGDIFHQVAICWSHMPELFEKQLRSLLSHPVFGTSTKDGLRDWEEFLSGIATKKTYSLLRLCYQASTALDLDVDADLSKTKGPLATHLLSSLSHGEALSLFTRLRKVHGDTVVSGHTFSYLGADVELHHIWLLSRNNLHDQANEIARTYIDARKRKAASASQPEQRTFYANSVISAAVASGSLERLREALNWVKRFMRDPLVFREVYNKWQTCDAVRLLSGVPNSIDSSFNLSELFSRVKLANSILASIFDTACEALQEPSFHAGAWSSILGIFHDVVKERMGCTSTLKRQLNALDPEIYSCLWEDTIKMVLAVEEKANKEDHEKLQANLLRGLLAFGYHSNIDIDIGDASSYQFMNNLAQARNELWCRLRTLAYPAVTTLLEPLPRGLPIQYLTAPWNFVAKDSLERIPYLASRVHNVLFPDPATTLQAAPIDEESRKAIGVCVDSYTYAAELYIPKRCTKAGKLERVMRVWDYATGPLSRGRMNESEAILFWEHAAPDYLKEWPTPHSLDRTRDVWPLIPEGDDHYGPCEWNPFTSRRPDDPQRDLDGITYLDLSLAVPTDRYNPTIHERMKIDTPRIAGRKTDLSTIWSQFRHIGEGGVLSALLYLDAKYVKTDRLLAKPFVSNVDVRYPPMYLDEDFLTSELVNPFSAARLIRGQLDAIPPSLLEQLTQNLIGALDAADPNTTMYNTLHEVAINLVIRLGESDRPSLATPLAIRIILDRPKSSSWHRHLLKKGFLLRLSASEARTCLETFANNIMHLIKFKETPEEGSESRHDVTHVKVTTIKLLVQLLQEPECAGVDYTLSILSALSKTNCHIDVRLNIVKTLLSLPTLDSPQHWDQTLTLLEPVIPLAGALDERLPIDEAKWMLCEQNFSLPEFPKEFSIEDDSNTPLLGALLEHFFNGGIDVSRLQHFFDRIIVPVVQTLSAQTAKWTTLFLRKYGNLQDAQEDIHLPCVPRHHNLYQRILSSNGNRLCCIPWVMLEEYMAYVHFNISPPKLIRDLNERLRADKALSSLAEVQTWLQLYGRGINAADPNLISLLDHAEDSIDETAITPRIIQEQFLKLFTVVLWNDTPTYEKLTNTVCREILRPRSLTKVWWTASGRPVVEAMIAYVNSLRTREWERDPNRAPFVLPDTFPWRLLTLDYPLPLHGDTDIDCERKSEAFANQLAVIVDEMSGLGVYHHQLDDLRTYLHFDIELNTRFQDALSILGGPLYDYDPLCDALANNRILTATYLGDLSRMRLSWVTSPEVLRCEVAAMLVEKVGWDVKAEKKVIREDVRQRLIAILAGWKACENEVLRRRGWQLENRYFG